MRFAPEVGSGVSEAILPDCGGSAESLMLIAYR
jgi:hypothetical protein